MTGGMWRRPQETRAINSSEPKDFIEAVRRFEGQAKEKLLFHRKLETCRNYLGGVIFDKNEGDITERFCIRLLNENPLVREVFDIRKINGNPPYKKSEIGQFAAYLIVWIREERENIKNISLVRR